MSSAPQEGLAGTGAGAPGDDSVAGSAPYSPGGIASGSDDTGIPQDGGGNSDDNNGSSGEGTAPANDTGTDTGAGAAAVMGHEPGGADSQGGQAPPGSAADVQPQTATGHEADGNTNAEPGDEGRPLPAEPEDVTVGDGSFTVTLTVRVDAILHNLNLLDRDKHELIPEDGVVFPVTTVTAYEGESVFNVLQREMRRARIHMASRFTPVYNSAYLEAINNIYEFDMGPASGWVYKVNDWFPNYGISRYLLRPGDVIELHYTCDYGRDLGSDGIAGGQWSE